MERAKRLYPAFVQNTNRSELHDPEKISSGTTPLVLDYIYYHLGIKAGEEELAGRNGSSSTSFGSNTTATASGTERNEKPLLGIDSCNAYIQGLRLLYESHGHVGYWMEAPAPTHPAAPDLQCRGNPLTGNRRVEQLRKTHPIILAQLGRAQTRASALTDTAQPR